MKFTVTVVSYKLGVVKDDQPVEDQQQGSPMTWWTGWLYNARSCPAGNEQKQVSK